MSVNEEDNYSMEDHNEKSNHNANNENPSTSLSSNPRQEETIETAVYGQRWLMLAVVALLNISNGAIWITFATIAQQTSEYFNVTTNAINWFSLVFYVTTIPMMFIALWVTDKYGFKPSTLSGSIFNGLGSVIRLLGTLSVIPASVRFPLAMTGQAIASLAQPFVMALPTKVSEVWFPENQRTLSTAIAAMANPLGCLLASLISPIVVAESTDVPTANYIISGLGIASGVLGFVVRRSNPAKPPSLAAAKATILHKEKAQSYLKHLGKIVRNKDFMILTLTIGGGMCFPTVFQTLMAQMICPWGYDDNVAGLCCITMVLGGFLGAAVISYVGEKTKLMEEIIKVGFSLTVVLAITLILIMRVGQIVWALALVSGLLGFTIVGIYPLCLEVGVETTYPLDEVFSSGLIVVSNQIQGTVILYVMEIMVQPLSSSARATQVCTQSEDVVYEFTNAGLFLVGYITLLNVILIIFFKPKYRRLEADKKIVQSKTAIPSITPDSGLTNNNAYNVTVM